MVPTMVVLLWSNCSGMVMDLWMAGCRVVVGIYGTWGDITCLVSLLMSIGLTQRRSIGSVWAMMWPEASVRAAIEAAEGRVGTVQIRNALGPAVDAFGM